MSSNKPNIKNVDAKDIAILRELDQNVRASCQEIGRKVRLSKEVVQYRIKKLEEEKIITGYWAMINSAPSQLHKILIKNRSLSGNKKEEFIEFVRKHKNAAWFASTEGNFDFIITAHTTEDNEIINFIGEIFSKYGSYFQEKHLLRASDTIITNEKYLYPQGKYLYEYTRNQAESIIPNDAVEKEMLKEISVNSRIKFTEIAKKIKLTPEAISHRYKNILKKGIITGLKIRLNLEKLGLSYYHLFISLQNQEIRKNIISYYKMHPAFNSLMGHVGYYDLHLEFIVHPEEIQVIMDEFSEKFGSHVASYELLRIREEYVLSILK